MVENLASEPTDDPNEKDLPAPWLYKYCTRQGADYTTYATSWSLVLSWYAPPDQSEGQVH